MGHHYGTSSDENYIRIKYTGWDEQNKILQKDNNIEDMKYQLLKSKHREKED